MFIRYYNNYIYKYKHVCIKTHFFIDIKVKEPTLESLTKKKREYMPPKFMSVSEACSQILKIIEKLQLSGDLKGTI